MNNYHLRDMLRQTVVTGAAAVWAEELAAVKQLMKDNGVSEAETAFSDAILSQSGPEMFIPAEYIAVLPDGTEMQLLATGMTAFALYGRQGCYTYYYNRGNVVPKRRIPVTPEQLPKLIKASNVGGLTMLLGKVFDMCNQEELKRISPLIPKLFEPTYKSWESTRRLVDAFLGEDSR